MSNTDWKLPDPPETEARVTEDVLGLQAPLVRVHRDHDGVWYCTGPNGTAVEVQSTTLAAVADAWPHVAGLPLNHGNSAVWSWARHSWLTDFECPCGSCEQPVADDLNRDNWPPDLQPNRVVWVAQNALAGSVPMTDIIYPKGDVTRLEPAEEQRTSDGMVRVAMANAIRRWPHTMPALRSLQSGRGMHWQASELNWHEYLLA